MVFFLFFAVYMTLRTNFIVSDFWRWLVVRMWVEVAFESFTTVIVAYLYREMGIVSKARAAQRATYKRRWALSLDHCSDRCWPPSRSSTRW